MSVYKDKKRGTYYISYYYRDPVTNEPKKKVKRGFKTKKEANDWEVENLIKDKYQQSNDQLTFKQVAATWADYNQASSESKRQHKEHFDYRFCKYFEKPIVDISKSDLIQWRTELAKTNWSTSTKNMTIGYVKSVFRFASEMYGISDPSTFLRRLKKTNDEILEEFDVWTPEDFSKFLSCIKEDEYKVFFEFLYWTGCRRGEAIALQKEDIEGNYANIKHSQRDATTGLRPTKTRQRRKIELDATLLEHLKPLLNEPGPYLFGGYHALAPTSIDRRFKKGIEESKVVKIRLHDLRHSHATWLINNGVNVVAVSKRLGHSTIEQTLKTYTHLLETSDQGMMLKINSFRDTKVIQNK